MLQLIDHNFRLHATQIPSQAEGMKVVDFNNLSFVDSGLSCDTFNIIHVNNGTHIDQAEVADAVNYYRTRNLAFCLWTNSAQLTISLETALNELSLRKQNEEAGMVLDLSAYQPLKEKEGYDIIPVCDAGALSEYANIIASNWEPPDQQVLAYYRITARHYLHAQHRIRLFICYHNGHPAATLELFPSDRQTIGLYGLATLKAFRGQGIGSALMIHALNYARRSGYKYAILQASEDGIGIYRKLGFRTHITYYEYA